MKIVEQDWVKAPEDILCVRVELEEKPMLNLNFPRSVVDDHFYDNSFHNEKEAANKVIEILNTEENILGSLVMSALKDAGVNTQRSNQKIGQFKVEPGHFGYKNFRYA